MRFIVEATTEIAKHQHPGMLVVLESTTYPGTTDEVVVPELTEGGAVLGKDVFVAFSPERVDPGQRDLQDQEHAEGARRRHARVHEDGDGAVLEHHRHAWSRCRAPRPPRWSSCSRTPSAR